MKRVLVAFSALALLGSAAVVVAQEDDPIKARQELMKSNGQAMGDLGKMAKGETPFDAAAAMAAFDKIHENAQQFDADVLFPPGSETGGDTKALPKIWEDMAGFKERAEAWKTAAATAAEAEITDVASIQATMGPLGETCGGCHENFRAKED
jgi:cytochrome c556